MTHREAMMTAMRELGVPEDAINSIIAAADTKMTHESGLTTLHDTNSVIELKPGQTEREYIDAIKQRFVAAALLRQLDPDYSKKRMEAIFEHLRKGLTKN